MGKSALLLASALLLTAMLPALTQTTSPNPSNSGAAAGTGTARNRIVGYTAWDDDYLYIALQINKPALTGKNSATFSNPLEDDAVIISLQTDDDHTAKQRTAHTVTFAVSAMGGGQLYLGAEAKPIVGSLDELRDRLAAIEKNETDPVVQQAKRDALLHSIPKYQVTQLGGPRPGATNAPGYTVEVAIPWSDLGGKPAADAKMGFNVAAQSKAPGSPLLQSLAPNVLGLSDTDNPSLWGEITFSNAPRPSISALLVSPRVLANKPTINGVLVNGEWNGLSSFDFGERAGAVETNGLTAATLAARAHPEFVPRPPQPVVPVSPPAILPPPRPHQPQKVMPLVFARYEYYYQGDPRKSAPAQHVVHTDNSTALAHHPLEGSGPWFSYDRADWHRQQLTEMRKAGVDVALPVYRGDARNRQLYANKGLTVLATALQYLRQAGQDYPQIALYLDTNSLVETFGDRPDLRDVTVQNALYSMIHDFYLHIPAEFRCRVPLSAGNGGGYATPVFLSDASAFKEFDAAFLSTLRARFAADFDGADLLLLGAGGFAPKAGLDGYFSDKPGQVAPLEGGWIKTALVGAGYDADLAAAVSPGHTDLRSRHNGDTYRSEWRAAIAKHPDWILLDNWNDYTLGGEIAPSLENGYVLSDFTHIATRQFAGNEPFRARYLWHDAPAALLPGNGMTLHLRVQNAGADGWGRGGFGQTPVTFIYRWKRGGQTVAEGAATEPADTVLSGQNFNLTLPIKAAGANGRALPDGDYTLEVVLVPTAKKPVSSGGEERSLEIPIKVRSADAAGAPQWAATLLSTDLPRMLESGSVYAVSATLRNDGTTAWRKADGARVTVRLYRAVTPTGAAEAAPAPTPVEAADATADLERDVLPGESVTVRLLLPLTDPAGKPLPVWNQDQNWMYLARWEVAAASGPRAVPTGLNPNPTVAGVSIAPTPLAVVGLDFGARIVEDNTPFSLPGERRQPITLSLKNTGAQTWKKEIVRVGYHWYYEDGTEFLWEDETSPLLQDVPPGGSVNNMLAWITAPPNDGTYYLVWDVKFGDMWASTASSTRVFDERVHAVRVVRGHLTFADLTKAYTLDGVTDTDEWNDGNFDGKGRTFPAALLPPYTDTPATPLSLFQASEKAGPESPRRVSFRWGPKTPRANNFIVCRGQRLELGKSAGKCRILHIIAASTGKEISTNLRLIFQEPTSQSEDLYAFSVSPWDGAPAFKEEVAFQAPFHHERNGVQPGAVKLYHYTITIREPRQLVAILLPDAPDIKIAAMTLER